MQILELKTNEEFLAAFSIMKELRTHLGKNTYLTLLNKMLKDGYRLFALKNKTQIAHSLDSLSEPIFITKTTFFCMTW
ncbi:MAG: hypothetical protein HY606_00185 [Planctomycetes bacterium]|nr:hypothetical protein [Planctomycetota bacterium]